MRHLNLNDTKVVYDLTVKRLARCFVSLGVLNEEQAGHHAKVAIECLHHPHLDWKSGPTWREEVGWACMGDNL